MLHLLLMKEGEPDGRLERGALAWGISFKATDRPEQQVEYVVNTTWWKSNFQGDLDEATEESEQNDAWTTPGRGCLRGPRARSPCSEFLSRPASRPSGPARPDGRLTLLITLRRLEDIPVELPILRGVEILVNHPDGQLQLVLASTGDWEMFHTLCVDLLSASNLGRNEPDALQLLFARLRSWQRLLSKGGGKLLDEREVRGLIG